MGGGGGGGVAVSNVSKIYFGFKKFYQIKCI